MSISAGEIVTLIITLIVTFFVWLLVFNKLLTISISAPLAKTKGINVVLFENIFVVLIAVIVMVTIKWIGILLINSLIILPAASSRNISSNVRQYTRYSVIISLISGILGIVISFWAGYATGPTIVVVSAVIYFLTLILKDNNK